MMTFPDFREKHTVFIFSDKADIRAVSFRNENVKVVDYEERLLINVSIHTLIAIYIVGEATITTNIIREAKWYGVSIFLLKENFSMYAGIVARAEGNVLLTRHQYKEDSHKNFEQAKVLVANKVWNQQSTLAKRKLKARFLSYENVLKKCSTFNDPDALRGFEGSASRQYFGEMFKEQDWYKRIPRAKPDIHNLLMDVGYTMLFNLTDSILQLFGFDTYLGFYHTLFYQRKSLVCDVMEPFRVIVDAQIRKSFNLLQISKDDFMLNSNGEYTFTSFNARKKYARIFSEELMANKEKIYLYIRDYYYYILNDGESMPISKL